MGQVMGRTRKADTTDVGDERLDFVDERQKLRCGAARARAILDMAIQKNG
jgi:hypothetical protein